MGQYRQWLHYRQVDQQLHTLKEHLSTELLRIHEQNQLDIPLLDSNNHMLQALLWYAKTSFPTFSVEQHLENTYVQQPEMLSQALFEHSRLPDLEPLFTNPVQEPLLPKQPIHTYAPLPPIPHQSYIAETGTPLSGQQQTEPQVALPWWLRKAALSAPGNGLDEQNIRTNRLVQRWLERWGLQEDGTTQYPNSNNGHQLEEGTKQ